MRKRQFFSFCNRNNCRLKQSKSYLVTNSLESLASVLQTTCQKYYSKYERRIVIKEANKVIQKSAQICLYFYFLCITNSNFIMYFNKRLRDFKQVPRKNQSLTRKSESALGSRTIFSIHCFRSCSGFDAIFHLES